MAATTSQSSGWTKSVTTVPTSSSTGQPSERDTVGATQVATPAASADDTLLRLEIAAEVPTPAEQMDARRALQLQLLTRRNEPAPAQTWGQDVARVLAGAYETGQARRLQQALKALLKR